ncbi:MAG: transglycosylase SLT domain-containing protein, partial [Streptococcaceae bacterium]|nr:transglycosylase SLT domain-containing protein [Streptococcaceae bacterium]
LLPSLIVYQLLGQIITKMASGMMGALKTNEQFSNSLNQVKVNLLTAFYPIYTAILPAINAFMSALAALTGQLASFIANVFGTTYQAAKQGASGLYDNVQAMNDTGSSASKAKEKVDKLQRSLMGFDEINRIGLDNNSDDDSLDGNSGSTPSVDFGKATGNYETPTWMKNMQKLLQDFFKPFQDAWKNQGQKVIDAWKYALGEVIGLASSIGKSFMEVWTNGTGQRFIENLLILLADMLNIVGDIAKAFKDAWNDDGRGTALIQSIFDMFNGILELLHSIATAFREAWNDGTGESIAANLLEIFTNIFNTIGNLANQFKKAWDEGGTGKDIFSAILGIIDDVLGHINNMTKATSDWAKTLNFTPLLNSIKKLLESIRPLSNKIGDGLEWFYKNVLLPLAKYSIEDLIPAFLDALKGAIDLLSGVIDAFKPAFDFLWNSVLKPLAEWSGGVIVDVLKALGDVLSTIGSWLSEHAEGFSNFVIAFGSFVAAIKIIGAIGTVIEVLSGIFTFLSGIGGLGGVLSAVGTAIGTVVGILGGPITIAIGVAIAAGVLLWKNWDTVKEKAGQLKDWIGEKWDNIKTATSEAWDNVKNWSSEKWESTKETIKTSASNAWDSIKTNWNNIKDKTSTTWDDIKSKTISTWDDVKSKTSNSAKDAWSNVNSWWSNLKRDTNSTFDEIVNKARSFGSSIGSALSGGWSYVYNGMKSQFKGMVEGAQWGVNQVIKGVKWVLNAVGAQGTANGISEWWPSYAKGTKYHPGGLALVNDGSGPYQEMYQLPNGKTGIFPKQRNMLVNLPRGTQVLDGKNTAKIVGAPAYAGGIFGSDFLKDFKIPSFNFDFDFSNIWSGFSSVASTVSDVASDVWGWVTDKASIVTHLWDKIGRGTGGFTDKAGDIASGIKNKGIEAAKELIFQKGQEGSPSPSGTGIERWRGVITKALSMNGLPTSGNYVNAWLRQVQSESGGNEKAVQGGYVDINTLSGDLAKGLLQTISATFNAYKFPGHSNIFNGFDNALAAINYAKNRYGYSGMLDVIGHGHGYAQGTPWVPEDQLAMIHEGEMVVPAEYNPYNTLSNFQGFDRLQLPEVFNETPMDYNNFSTYGNSDDVSNYGINNMNNSLTNAIMMLIQKLGAEPTQDTNGDIIINIGGHEFGRIAVSEINKYHQQIGYTELNL